MGQLLSQCKEDLNPIYMCTSFLKFISKVCSACTREFVHLNNFKAPEERYFPRNSWNRTMIILSVHLLHFQAAPPIQVISARLYLCSIVWGDGKFL